MEMPILRMEIGRGHAAIDNGQSKGGSNIGDGNGNRNFNIDDGKDDRGSTIDKGTINCEGGPAATFQWEAIDRPQGSAVAGIERQNVGCSAEILRFRCDFVLFSAIFVWRRGVAFVDGNGNGDAHRRWPGQRRVFRHCVKRKGKK
jgi:hypothetical protein